MANETLLLVDDDPDLREILVVYMKKNEFSVFTANDGLSALSIIYSQSLDLIVLDVMMPGLDGFELCQEIRKKSDVPILFLSARGDDVDKILGLGIGGDDFITKPVSPAVLMARIKANLRRNRILQHHHPGSVEPTQQTVLEFPGLLIDLKGYDVKVNGSLVTLSAKEYKLLCLLARNPDRVYSVEQLYELIWGEHSLGDHRTVMVHVSNIRRKIESDPVNPIYIKTVRGIGYKFNGFNP